MAVPAPSASGPAWFPDPMAQPIGDFGKQSGPCYNHQGPAGELASRDRRAFL